MSSVEGKIVVITGAAKGIGKACAKLFGKRGANIILIDIDSDSLLEIDTELKTYGINTVCICADVSVENDIKNAIKQGLKYFDVKYIDILINNAAIQTTSNLHETSDKMWRRVLDVNLTGVFICTKEVSKSMCSGGKILNMLSSHFDKPRINRMSYDSSKAGVAMLTKESALALCDYGITVNAVSYGAVNTPMNAEWMRDEKLVNKTLQKVPMRIIFEPEQIADFAYNIIENFADYTTGSIFTVDAGRSLF